MNCFIGDKLFDRYFPEKSIERYYITSRGSYGKIFFYIIIGNTITKHLDIEINSFGVEKYES